MLSCWIANPDQRPTFDEIRTRLSGFLDVCSQAYGYIQFQQQYQALQANADPPASPKTTIPPLIVEKETEGEYSNDSESD